MFHNYDRETVSEMFWYYATEDKLWQYIRRHNAIH